jgi:hypothetical protein
MNLDHDKTEDRPELRFILNPGPLDATDPTGQGRILTTLGDDCLFYCPKDQMAWMQKAYDLTIENGHILIPSALDQLFPIDAPFSDSMLFLDACERAGIERIGVE